MVASPLQRCENANFFSRFPFGGIQSQGLLSVIPLELQGKSINHFLGHSLSYTMEFLHRFGLRLEDGIFSPYKRTPVVQPPHQSKFLREGVRGRALFSKSPSSPPKKPPLHPQRLLTLSNPSCWVCRCCEAVPVNSFFVWKEGGGRF